jgi:hypothetical protein
MKDKLLAAAAYIFWIPSLYIVLTEKRKDEFLGQHGARALFLGLKLFFAFFVLRLLLDLVWRLVYIPNLDLIETLAATALWGYAVYQGVLAARGVKTDDLEKVRRHNN